MNVTFDDGSHMIQPYTAEAMAKAAEDPHFVSAKIYQPGKIVKMSDRTYKVGRAGNLIRQEPELR